MSFNFKIFIYGYSEEKLNEMSLEFKKYSYVKIKLTPVLDETNIVEHCFNNYKFVNQMLFINSDTMKRVNISGSSFIENIVLKIEGSNYADNKPYVVLFNRYQDCGVQSHYIKEVLDSVSLFKSYSPSNSDCFFLSTEVVANLRKIVTVINYKERIFTLITKGVFNCYSFNPNLFTFRIEDSSDTMDLQVTKSSMLRKQDKSNVAKNISLFFSSHIILFWVFLIFFICSVFVIIVKVIKLSSIFL